MTARTDFGGRLRAAMAARGPLCVGIDAHPELLARWELPDDAGGLERFALTVVEALGQQVAVFKPQSAFYERHGSAGIAVLERTIAAVRAAGALCLLDVKRGDVGSTAAGYADAYLRPGSPLAVDAITASPYLGFGSLRPLFATAAAYGRGVFVVALTSNPEGAQVQRARVDGQTVAESILRQVSAANTETVGWGPFGAVVGATIAPGTEDLDVNGPLLAPGFGAQGGAVEDLGRIFGNLIGDVLPSTSRGVLAAGPRISDLQHAAASVAEKLSVLTA
jgi:orotidine-5'-phosphate decarboxylase